MGDRRVLSSLVTIGLIASLVLPTSVSFAASPEPKSSDPKASDTEGVSVLAATASSTISVSGGPLTITINNELNCDVDHVADPLHGEFYGETACATLVAVDGTLFGPVVVLEVAIARSIDDHVLADHFGHHVCVERPLVEQEGVERLHFDSKLDEIARCKVPHISGDDRIRSSCESRRDDVVVARVDSRRHRRQETRHARRHRLREVLSHEVESVVDPRRIDPTAYEAPSNLLKNLLTPGWLEEATLGEPQEQIDSDMRMEDISVQDRNVSHDQSV